MERRAVLSALGAGLLPHAARDAQAQGLPITLYVGFAPGGAVDYVARLLAEPLQALLQRPVLVDNRQGAGGQLAMAALKAAPADGSAYVLTPPPVFTVYPALYAKLPYGAEADFVPVSGVCTYEHTLTLGPASPAKTLPEFIAWCRANPSRASVGVPNLGSAPHFLVWLTAREAGFAIEPIGYRGGGPHMIQDVLTGQVPGCISVMSNVAELHRAGRLRIAATSGPKRSALFPEVPTFAEQGVASAQIEEWFAFFARQGTPADETTRFADAVRQVLGRRELRARLFAQGYDAQAWDAARLAQDIANESRRWAEVVRRSGFKL